MKNHKTTAFTVLSEELNSKTLMNLVGGTNANPILNNSDRLFQTL